MDHKAHRSAQSGAKAAKKDRAKGKEKQLAFNPKVLSMLFFWFSSHPSLRHLPLNLAGEQTDRAVVLQNRARLASTFLLSTAPHMETLLQSSSPS